MVNEDEEHWSLRMILGIGLAFILFNAFMGFYIVFKMMLPQRVRYLTLWLFYIFALGATVI